MGIKEKNVSEKSTFSIVMYVVASLVGIIGVALLVNNMILFKATVNQAVQQGYAIATVRKALITSQLLPGIFEPIALYGGIAFVLLGVGKVNKKVSKCLTLLTKVEVGADIFEESVVDQNVADIENAQAIEEIKASEQIETSEKI